MFSCFCVSKKKSSKQTIPFQKQNKIQTLEISNEPIKEKEVIDASTTLDTPQVLINRNFSALKNYQQFEKQMQTTQNKMDIKRVTSIKEFQQDSYEDLDEFQSQSQDSDTVPYMSKKQPSQVSTPKNIKKIHPSKKMHENQKIMNQVNQYQLQFPFSKTPNEDLIKRYFSIDNQINYFYSKPAIKPQKINQIKESIGIESIDYSRYSEIDKQVSSNQILDLDQQMQSKLQQLQNNSSHYYQKTIQNSSTTKIVQSKTKSDQPQKKDCSRFQKNKFHNIQNDLNELEKAENEIHSNLFHNSKLIFKINNPKNTSIEKEYQQKTNLNQKLQSFEQRQEIQKSNDQNHQSFTNNLIQNTIKSELDSIIDTNIYFCDMSSLKSPQNLQNLKKIFKVQENENELMDETLQEAQNAFHCFSINQQFSRALIKKNLDLAFKIFQRMTKKQKNQKDLKGYFPVHLTILKAILNQKYFQLAKKIMYHPDVRLDVQGPTGWTPLQETISYKHIRLSPNIFVAAHRKKLGLIRNKLQESSRLLRQMKDFYFELDVKVDSFIPLLSTITPQDTIKITKIGSSLMIDYTLVGYEYLSCKRRDMGFLLNEKSIYALNRSKLTYCDLLQQMDRQQIQLLVVQILQCQTKKIQPQVNKIQIKESKTIFDNQIIDVINSYKAKKFTFGVDYTSKTQKRMPQKLQKVSQNSLQNSPLFHLTQWEKYLQYQPQVNIKPKNKNKKIQLQMWLSKEFQFQISDLLKIFQLFSLCNPVAKIISSFLNQNFSSLNGIQGYFPVKIDVPINFSLYFNLEFKKLKFQDFQKNQLQIQPSLQKCTRKEFQNIAQSKEKRSFAISAFT